MLFVLIFTETTVLIKKMRRRPIKLVVQGTNKAFVLIFTETRVLIKKMRGRPIKLVVQETNKAFVLIFTESTMLTSLAEGFMATLTVFFKQVAWEPPLELYSSKNERIMVMKVYGVVLIGRLLQRNTAHFNCGWC